MKGHEGEGNVGRESELKLDVREVGKALGDEAIGEKGSGRRGRGKCRGGREKRGRKRYTMIRRVYFCELEFYSSESP